MQLKLEMAARSSRIERSVGFAFKGLQWFLMLCLQAAGQTPSLAGESPPGPSSPNIVLILVDDQGWTGRRCAEIRVWKEDQNDISATIGGFWRRHSRRRYPFQDYPNLGRSLPIVRVD